MSRFLLGACLAFVALSHQSNRGQPEPPMSPCVDYCCGHNAAPSEVLSRGKCGDRFCKGNCKGDKKTCGGNGSCDPKTCVSGDTLAVAP